MCPDLVIDPHHPSDGSGDRSSVRSRELEQDGLTHTTPESRKIRGIGPSEFRRNQNFHILRSKATFFGPVRPEEAGPVRGGNESHFERPPALGARVTRHLANPGGSPVVTRYLLCARKSKADHSGPTFARPGKLRPPRSRVPRGGQHHRDQRGIMDMFSPPVGRG